MKYFNPYLALQWRDTLNEEERYLTRFNNTLKSLDLPSGIEGIFLRVQIGASAELDAALAEVEGYIKATRMPVYLQDDARQRARESVNADIAEKLTPLVARFPTDLKKEDLKEQDGFIRFTEDYRKKVIQEKCSFDLPEDVAADLEAFKKWLAQFEDWNRRYDMAGYVLGQLRLGEILNPEFVLLSAQRKN